MFLSFVVLGLGLMSQATSHSFRAIILQFDTDLLIKVIINEFEDSDDWFYHLYFMATFAMKVVAISIAALTSINIKKRFCLSVCHSPAMHFHSFISINSKLHH